jgi:hypothetical protein
MAGRIAYYGNIVKDGLVLLLDAAKKDSYPGSGTLWRDVSGNGNNGTLINSPTFNSDNGGSVVFDGSNDYVDTNYVTPIGLGEITFSAWIKYTASQIGVFIAKRLDAPTYQQLSIYVAGDSPGNIAGTKIAISDVQTTSLLRAGISTNSYNDDKWHYIVGTRTSTTTFLYIDGILISSLSSAAINLSASSKLFIGRSGNNQTVAGGPFNGSISQVQIYNKALSATEVLQNYNATKGRYL